MAKKAEMFSSIKRQPMHQLIEDQIRSAIFKNRYKPGDKIPTERELSTMFDASRASVREALRSLEKTGLITKKLGKHGGSFVNKIDSLPVVNSFMDMFQLGRVGREDIRQARLIFEPAIAHEAAKVANDQDIERLKQIHENRSKQFYQKKAINIRESNFHSAIAEITGNRVFVVIMRALNQMHHSFEIRHAEWDAGMKETVIAQHAAIARQIEERNPEMAYKKMEEHILFETDPR